MQGDPARHGPVPPNRTSASGLKYRHWTPPLLPATDDVACRASQRVPTPGMAGQRYRQGRSKVPVDLARLSGLIPLIATDYPHERLLGRNLTSTFAMTTTRSRALSIFVHRVPPVTESRDPVMVRSLITTRRHNAIRAASRPIAAFSESGASCQHCSPARVSTDADQLPPVSR